MEAERSRFDPLCGILFPLLDHTVADAKHTKPLTGRHHSKLQSLRSVSHDVTIGWNVVEKNEICRLRWKNRISKSFFSHQHRHQ